MRTVRADKLIMGLFLIISGSSIARIWYVRSGLCSSTVPIDKTMHAVLAVLTYITAVLEGSISLESSNILQSCLKLSIETDWSRLNKAQFCSE